jgi:protocadherin Fat 1/2/3
LVRASDWGTPFRRQAELRLTVRVRDINDNRPQFERVNCVGDISRDVSSGTEILTLSAIDFDNGDIVSYRIVSGNADGCFALDASKGVLSTVCDLRTLPMTKRVLNVTATDGQHFSDVSPVVIAMATGGGGGTGNLVYSALGVDDSLFSCDETGVVKRLTSTLTLAEASNDVSGEEDVFATVR